MAAAAVSGSSAGGSGYYVSDRPPISKVLEMKAARYGCVYKHVCRSYDPMPGDGQSEVACIYKDTEIPIPPNCNNFRALSVYMEKISSNRPEIHYFFICRETKESSRIYLVEDKSVTFEAALVNVLSRNPKEAADYSIGIIFSETRVNKDFDVNKAVLLVERERKQYKNMKWYAQYIRLFNSYHRLQFYRLVVIGSRQAEPVAIRMTQKEENIPEECENFAALAPYLKKEYGISAAATHFFVCKTSDQGMSTLHPILDNNKLFSKAFADAMRFSGEDDFGTWRLSVGAILDDTKAQLNVEFNVNPELEIDSKNNVRNIPREVIVYTDARVENKSDSELD